MFIEFLSCIKNHDIHHLYYNPGVGWVNSLIVNPTHRNTPCWVAKNATQPTRLRGYAAEAINTVFPNTRIQLCLVHLVRHSVKYVPWKDYKPVTAGLKQIYQSVTEEEALLALEQFSACWDGKYPQISRTHWHNLNTLFSYPDDIRKAIYTTNTIESLNSVIRKALQKRKLFLTDESAQKVVYLAIQEASQKWTMPIKNWKSALNRFMIEFEDRLQDYI